MVSPFEAAHTGCDGYDPAVARGATPTVPNPGYPYTMARCWPTHMRSAQYCAMVLPQMKNPSPFPHFQQKRPGKLRRTAYQLKVNSPRVVTFSLITRAQVDIVSPAKKVCRCHAEIWDKPEGQGTQRNFPLSA